MSFWSQYSPVIAARDKDTDGVAILALKWRSPSCLGLAAHVVMANFNGEMGCRSTLFLMGIDVVTRNATVLAIVVGVIKVCLFRGSRGWSFYRQHGGRAAGIVLRHKREIWITRKMAIYGCAAKRSREDWGRRLALCAWDSTRCLTRSGHIRSGQRQFRPGAVDRNKDGIPPLSVRPAPMRSLTQSLAKSVNSSSYVGLKSPRQKERRW